MLIKNKGNITYYINDLKKDYAIHVEAPFSSPHETIIISGKYYNNLIDWLDGKGKIQVLLSELTDAHREYLMTGLLDDNFDEVFVNLNTKQQSLLDDYLKNNINQIPTNEFVNQLLAVASKEEKTATIINNIGESIAYNNLAKAIQSQTDSHDPDVTKLQNEGVDYCKNALHAYMTHKMHPRRNELLLFSGETHVNGTVLLGCFSGKDNSLIAAMFFSIPKPRISNVFLDTLVQLEATYENIFSKEFDKEKFMGR